MKIFISWSGERSEALAKALRDWFPLVLHYVQPWLSQSDIKAGDRWNVEIAKELESCNFGVICITRENLGAPWILFEAGALAKSMQDGRVIPVLLDLELKDLSGPLAQFQAKKTDQTGIKELLVGLNKLATTPVPEGNLDKLFGMAWGDLEKQIASIPKGNVPVKISRPQGEVLEELVASIRNVEMRIREGGDDFSRLRRKRMRFHSSFLHELLRGEGLRRHDPLRYVIIFSFIKEEYPWLFELALDAFRAARSGSRQKARASRQVLLDAYRVVRRGPMRELMLDDKFAHMIMHEVEFLLEGDLDRIEDEFDEAEPGQQKDKQ
jgi:hypothetical protein